MTNQITYLSRPFNPLPTSDDYPSNTYQKDPNKENLSPVSILDDLRDIIEIDPLKFKQYEENINYRLSLCPPLTYKIYPTPTQNLFYLSYVIEDQSIQKWKIIYIPPDRAVLLYPDNNVCNCQQTDLINTINESFKDTLEGQEFRRRDLILHNIQKNTYQESYDVVTQKLKNKLEGTFAFLPSEEPYQKELVYTNMDLQIKTLKIFICDNGYIEIDNLRFLSFEPFSSYFKLNNNLTNTESTEKELIKEAEEEHRKLSNLPSDVDETPVIITCHLGNVIVCPKPIKTLSPHYFQQTMQL